MVIDDHDMHDDWNISEAWCEEMERAARGGSERVLGGMTSYWIYQFIGNLSPGRAARAPAVEAGAGGREDAAPVLREFMEKDDREREGKRWSYCRDLGTTRLIVMDVRTGRCLDEGERKIVDDDEWDWIVERATEGEFDHLLFGTSDPYLLAPSFHHLEAWNERVCDGAVGGARRARPASGCARTLDFDHWARVRGFLRAPDAADRGARLGQARRRRRRRSACSPATSTTPIWPTSRSGATPASDSAVYQAVCSPYRNALDDQRAPGDQGRPLAPGSGAGHAGLASAAGVEDPGIRWRFREGPYFDNQVATLKLDGRSSELVSTRSARPRGPRRAPRAGLRDAPEPGSLAPSRPAANARFARPLLPAERFATLPRRITNHFNQERSESK